MEHTEYLIKQSDKYENFLQTSENIFFLVNVLHQSCVLSTRVSLQQIIHL